MHIDVVTTFTQYLTPLELSLVGKARERGILDIAIHDLRGWANDRHHTTDDSPYGGGAGMVMLPEVWGRALDDITSLERSPRFGGEAGVPQVLIPSPSGRVLTQAWAQQLSRQPWLVIACGRYEGIDARVTADASRRMTVTEFSLGDYVLNGGEVAALALIEAVARLLPGVVGNPESLVEESHSDGLIEYPSYTRPPVWRGLDVPEVLMSGHHGRIARWRRDESIRRTAQRRPDLIESAASTAWDNRDRQLLADLGFIALDDGRFGPPPQALAD